MQNCTGTMPQQQNLLSTNVLMDNQSRQVEPWIIVVPVILLGFLVLGTAVVIIVVTYFYKCKESNIVFPLQQSDRAITEPHRHNLAKLSKTEDNVDVSCKKAVTHATDLNDISNSDFSQLDVTRTHSLTVLVPKGKTLSDVFVSEIDTGEFKEPEEMEGKLRWQIILLESTDIEEQSSTSLSDEEGITETVYGQGVYIRWEDTLKDLRNAFIETKQIEHDEASFCFLWTDVPGEQIDITSEGTQEMRRLSRSVIKSRIVHIERVDPETVQRVLCICGKHALFQCIHCQNRGYCSEKCEQEDTSHKLYCSVNVE